MRERSATVFPYAIAGALPLAGLAVAALERRTYDAALVTASLRALVWTITLDELSRDDERPGCRGGRGAGVAACVRATCP